MKPCSSRAFLMYDIFSGRMIACIIFMSVTSVEGPLSVL
jgi:hypothetical protein